MGKYIDSRMEELKKKHPSIGDWRNTGLLGCIELVKNKQQKNQWHHLMQSRMKWRL
jgi:taurine--2-oxoglutarate transaminase